MFWKNIHFHAIRYIFLTSIICSPTYGLHSYVKNQNHFRTGSANFIPCYLFESLIPWNLSDSLIPWYLSKSWIPCYLSKSRTKFVIFQKFSNFGCSDKLRVMSLSREGKMSPLLSQHSLYLSSIFTNCKMYFFNVKNVFVQIAKWFELQNILSKLQNVSAQIENSGGQELVKWASARVLVTPSPSLLFTENKIKCLNLDHFIQFEQIGTLFVHFGPQLFRMQDFFIFYDVRSIMVWLKPLKRNWSELAVIGPDIL